MQPRAESLIWDIATNAKIILEVTEPDSLDLIRTDFRIRYIVQHAMQICGEAMYKLDRVEPETA